MEIPTLAHMKMRKFILCISGDSSIVVNSNNGCSIQIWSLADGKILSRIALGDDPSELVGNVTTNFDGSLVAAMLTNTLLIFKRCN